MGWRFFAPDATPIKSLPIDLRNARAATEAGNAFPTVVALTDWEFWHWEFLKDVVGAIYGVVKVPNDWPSPTVGARVRVALAANATTGVTTWRCSTKAVADAESLNPTALVDEADTDVTVPGTAYLRKDVSWTLTEQPSAGDTVLVQLAHVGTAANDTLAVNTLLLGAWLETD